EYVKNLKTINKGLLVNNIRVDRVFMTRNQDGSNCELIESTTYMLNFMEFLSVGMRFGDFDEELVKKTMKSMMLRLYNICEPYISDSQLTNKSTLENFTAVCLKWSA
ncbi:MAG TPA: DUF4760 domain-containing protein, partial [Aquirhabdus sp.]